MWPTALALSWRSVAGERWCGLETVWIGRRLHWAVNAIGRYPMAWSINRVKTSFYRLSEPTDKTTTNQTKGIVWLGWQFLRQNGRILLRLDELEKRLNELEFGEPVATAGSQSSSLTSQRKTVRHIGTTPATQAAYWPHF